MSRRKGNGKQGKDPRFAYRPEQRRFAAQAEANLRGDDTAQVARQAAGGRATSKPLDGRARKAVPGGLPGLGKRQ